MKHKLLWVIAIVFNPTFCFGQQVQLNTRLSYTIDSLFKSELRNAYDLKSTEKEAKKAAKKNFPLVKAILDRYGFPGYSLVGERSSNNYAFLVMYSNFDTDFQKKAFSLLEIQVKNKNANTWRYATLVDLINIEDGKKQIYGTQLKLTDTGYVVKPLIDPANVDTRRKAVGINAPLARSLEVANGFYKASKTAPVLNGVIRH